MAELLVNANSLHLPLADESVDMCVTSPPYYGLRDYGTSAQLGLEETPEQYIENMVAVFREVWRVLKPHGTLWLNIGDSYFSDTKGSGGPSAKQLSNVGSRYAAKKFKRTIGLKPKDLIGIPWMLAFALRQDGWYLRSDIIWGKPNPMPESVTDRPTKAHEYLFLLSKQPKYYYDADAVREPVKIESKKRAMRGNSADNKYAAGSERPSGVHANTMSQERKHKGYENMEEEIARGNTPLNPAGRNRRSVWSIPTQPYSGAHFAAFPEALVEPCIKAGTSEKGVCSECGAPWVRVVERTPMLVETSEKGNAKHESGLRTSTSGTMVQAPTSKTIGWQPTCAHETEPVPAIVFDPFLGSGTTALVARQLGRHAIGTDLSFSYLHEQARARLELEPAWWEGALKDDTDNSDLPLFNI